MAYEPRIIAYLCTWCSYTGADTAGINRLKSPYNIHAIRVPCSGRVSPELIMRTFDQGADGVLVLACHIGECHYDSGNHRTAKRLPLLQALMSFVGLEQERMHLDYVSASEGERFARIVNDFTENVRRLGPVNWRVSKDQVSRIVEGKVGWDWKMDANLNLLSRVPDPSSILEQKTNMIRAKAKEILATNQVSCVIGYEVGSRGWTRPAFIYHPEETDRLIWNHHCTHNLTLYLSEKLNPNNHLPFNNSPHRVALVVKPCDSRTINVLLAENQIKREQVYVIGVSCEGIVQDHNRVSSINDPTENEIAGNLQTRCQLCSEPVPVIYDTFIGESIISGQNVAGSGFIPLPTITQFQNMSLSARMEFWVSQFDRCIRCYACRQVCPLCNCPTCLYERDDSLWVGMNINVTEKRTFHLGRAYHLAGRCIGCGECERVCPMNIPIGYLNSMLAQEIKENFNFVAGLLPVISPCVTKLGSEEVYG